MTVPHVVVRVEVTGVAPSSQIPGHLSTLVVVTEAGFRALQHEAEALHRAVLLGIVDAEVTGVRTIASTMRAERPMRRRPGAAR